MLHLSVNMPFVSILCSHLGTYHVTARFLSGQNYKKISIYFALFSTIINKTGLVIENLKVKDGL